MTWELKKPQKFENRKLGSEKTGEKKWTLWRKFKQNGVTKFNYHFNAEQKLFQILERAKSQHKDDYTQLLSFYNFDLARTAQDRDLDSVIYKANAGILIHDLRNSWIDNLYMLMGQAYYYKNILDTAYLTFQYVNYAFSPKEKDGYDIPIGSNAVEGGNAFSISTKENKSLPSRVWTSYPSRNESFIWQIKTFLARQEMPEASGLIETLRHDPNFPERLTADLREVQAHYFYIQQIYDSAAFYLEQALPKAANNEEKARWEYLIGQLYEKTGQHSRASDFYGRTIQHTLDPVLEVYARLNSIRQNKGDEKAIQENIDALLKMAKRDKYINYRDIIYYMTAQIELERSNVPGAKDLLLISTRFKSPLSDPNQASKAFLQLAELSFAEKNYPDAKRFYDSITVPAVAGDPAKLEKRKETLGRIVAQQEIIYRQDSLQRIAALPEEEREAILKKMARQLRKQQGVKEEEDSFAGGVAPLQGNNAAPTDLFSNNSKGDWYFYNATLKGKGYNEFRNKWGNRKNVDNWRRIAAVNQAMNAQATVPGTETGNVNDVNNGNTAGPADLSYEGLLKNLPLTPTQLQLSNDSIEQAQLLLGKTLMDGLEDYYSAINTLETFLERFSYSQRRPEALFYLYYCYYKTGQQAKANSVAAELKQRYGGTEYEKLVSNPTGTPDQLAKADMTRRYEQIYNLFIEGSFARALAEKKVADSLYGVNYWTPQLLYIQSVYHIKERQDDTAKNVLQNIINLYSSSPLAEKAQIMIDVLNRRKQIEDYLTNLKIERPKEDSLTWIDDKVVQAAPAPPVVDSAIAEPPVVKDPDLKSTAIGKKDSTGKKDIAAVPKPEQLTGNKPPEVVPSKLPPAEKPVDSATAQPEPPVAVQPRPDTAVVTAPTLPKADTSMKAPVVTAPKTDTGRAVVTAPPPPQPDTSKKVTAPVVTAPPKDTPVVVTAPPQPKPDTPRTITPPPVVTAPAQPRGASKDPSGYINDPASTHLVAMVLSKVDRVYIAEASNAFNRYNKNRISQQLETRNDALNDTLRLVLIGNFENAEAALDYMGKISKAAPTEIVSWLPAGKYSFTIITPTNLALLKQQQNLEIYRDFLRRNLPGKGL
ncbi:MAG: hypothetical protein P0Y53_14665 [Candidatus Pseudobacter hemicellulosilyticus]|uniref:Tetratricopeptide repeat protein n=1 Tax=Candidatus Pseudobacter hemicellulosilyticus TaxID=3121375 RepID=A0AAJ5WKV0_9BACT|nr:MAG: hypothetical protein P0Y53_14665 [Pseudobacter sp.]